MKIALLLGLTAPWSAVVAQEQPLDRLASACRPMPQDQMDILWAFRQKSIIPAQDVDYSQIFASSAMQALRREQDQRLPVDYGNSCRYHFANAARRGAAPAVVFIGDSITENWAQAEVGFFDGRKTVGRGIGGQTTPQMLVRFYDDVVSLRPRAVHIMAGTNDIAGNTGYRTDDQIVEGIRAMTELALANKIRVFIGSIPPAKAFGWAPEVRPRERIVRINARLQSLAREKRVTFVDYYSQLVDDTGGLRSDLSNDGVHPNANGYVLMTRLADLKVGLGRSSR